jgi:hypothetical protein
MSTMNPMNSTCSSLNPWDRWRSEPVSWFNPADMSEAAVDRGVAFFVVALLNAGAVVLASCDNQRGWFIRFAAPQRLALQVVRAGYFDIELHGPNVWEARLMDAYTVTPKALQQTLRWAANCWTRAGLSADSEVPTTGEPTTLPAITVHERFHHGVA